ncbi:MAG: alpha/beta hydrolase [Phycisphaerales bacterium]|nr:alpha/beta hydrolase [Phycisphaerales bacterium]
MRALGCALILVMLCGALAACGQSYSKLVCEDDCGFYKELKAADAVLPRETTLVPTFAGHDEPVAIAVHRVVAGKEHSRGLVLIHGVLADSWAWRYLTSGFAAEHGVWLLDLPGCGRSECPIELGLEENEYELRRMARRMLEALRGVLDTSEAPERLTLVGHSLGGAVSLQMLGDPDLKREFADVIGRIDTAVLLSPLDVHLERSDPAFVRLATVSGLDVWLALNLGILDEEMAKIILNNTRDPSLALREDADKRIEIVRNKRSRRSLQAMLRYAVPHQELRPDWDRIDELTGAYGGVTQPVRILWGAHDEVLPLSMGYKLTAELPRAELLIFPECRHSVYMDRPRLTAAAVLDFIDDQTGLGNEHQRDVGEEAEAGAVLWRPGAAREAWPEGGAAGSDSAR